MNHISHFILVSVFFAAACICLPAWEAEAQSQHINYTESFESFPNPERGFFQDSEVTLGDSPLTLWQLSRYRPLSVTLLNRYYYLGAHLSSPIPQVLLDGIRSDLAVVRQAGMKMILKFAYTRSPTNPVDARVDTMLLHLDQLAPIFQENKDVIAGMEAGFIGAWGEWAYSSHGYADSVRVQAELVRKILEVFPYERMVCIRTVRHKFDIFGTAELSPGEAHTQTNRSRVGFHNDGFLKSADDAGTFYINGQPTDVLVARSFMERETRFVLMGGETSGPSYRTNCTTGLSELRRFHYSFLNRTYHPAVLDSFEIQGCWPTIDRLLGYRLVLLDGSFTSGVRSEGTVNVDLRLLNKGFAAPYNPRTVELVLRRLSDGALTRFPLNLDPRFWLPLDTVHIETTLTLPPSVTAGEYSWLLNLPDPEPSIRHRPEYAIRCANVSTWESGTGFNRLNASLTVTPSLRPLIRGNVYFDQNADGVQQGSEPRLAGWRVRITGPTSSSTLTDSSGNFLFPQIGLGTYTVRADDRESWTQTSPSPGPGFTVDVTVDTSTYDCGFALHTPSAVPMTIRQRWNIVSLPVSTGGLPVHSLFLSATSGASTFDGNYRQADTLENGLAYWIKFPVAQTEWIAGTPNIAETLQVHQGWNLIGALGIPVQSSTIFTEPEGILSSAFWEYMHGYAHADTLFPGKGYWVFADGPGLLIMNSIAPVAAKKILAGSVSDRAGYLQFQSSDGSVQQFRIYGSRIPAEDLKLYTLPPSPPSGVFDVRMMDQASSQAIAPNSFKTRSHGLRLMINSASFPIVLKWSAEASRDGSYEIQIGNSPAFSLTGEGKRFIYAEDLARGQSVTVFWRDDSERDPSSFSLDQNYPNPFNPTTTIRYTLPEASSVTLKIFTTLGQEVATLVDGPRPPGLSSIQWNASTQPSGTYFYQLRAVSIAHPEHTVVLGRPLTLIK